ncbi:hypothetical protein LX36DRAFT_656453 [Colletotrichum falcatum]|nr:hypothetical protein LX36DRAFT_656453 [Colletotrichum falcatum]
MSQRFAVSSTHATSRFLWQHGATIHATKPESQLRNKSPYHLNLQQSSRSTTPFNTLATAYLLFEPADISVSTHALLVDASLKHIKDYNNTSQLQTIQRRQLLGHLVSIDPAAQAWYVESEQQAEAIDLAQRWPRSFLPFV